MAYTGKQTSNSQSSIQKSLERTVSQEQTPNCPYTRSKCVNYNPLKKRGNCQSHGNSHSKSVRCTSLPYFVPDGWKVAILKGGRLYV
jgi:hypothetical protein